MFGLNCLKSRFWTGTSVWFTRYILSICPLVGFLLLRLFVFNSGGGFVLDFVYKQSEWGDLLLVHLIVYLRRDDVQNQQIVFG